MFKVILLALSVSVVWSTVQATYILDNNGGFRYLGNTGLDTFHGSILQSDISLDYGDHHNHGVVIPQISNSARYINQPVSTFSKNHDSSPWRPVIKHNTVRHKHYFPQSQQNKYLHQNQLLHQHHIDVKSSDAGFNLPHIRNQHVYRGHQLRSHVPSGLILNHDGIILDNDDYHSIGHHQGIGQILQIPRVITEKSDDISQQKFIEIDVQKSEDPKPVSKVNIKSYEADGQKDSANDYSENRKPTSNQDAETKKQENDNSYDDSQEDDHNNENVYQVVYNHNQGHQVPVQYLKLQEENGGYVVLPNSLGSHGLYRGIEGVPYHSGLNSHGAIQLGHGIPILLNGNLDDRGEILIGHRNEEGHVSLNGGQYILVRSNISETEDTQYPDYPDGKKYDSDEKLEQKPEPVEQRSEDSGSDYKGSSEDSKYSDSNKGNSYEEQKSVDVSSYNVEQKSLDVGLKGQKTEQKSLYESDGGNDQSYDDAKNPKYEATTPQKSVYGLEQKPLEVGIKNVPKVEYDGIGSAKTTNADTQQKIIDSEYKGEESDYKTIGSSISESPGIGSIDEPKYSDSKSSNENLEQKSIQTETYSELKATFKSSGISSIQDSLPKDSSDYTKNAINNLKKDIDAKISEHKPLVYMEKNVNSYRNQGHSPGRGGSSTSYFNGGHPSSINHHQRHGNPHSFSSGIHNARPRLGGNSYTSSSGNYPKQSGGSYFSLGNTNSPGNGLNHHRPLSNTNSYQRPLSPSSHIPRGGSSYSNRQSGYGGINRAPSSSGHRIPSYKAPSGGTSRYPGSQDPYNNEKSVKVNYEYPSRSLLKYEPIYVSSVKPSGVGKRLHPGSNTNVASRNYQGTSSGHPVSRSHLLSSSRSNPHTPATSVSYLKRDNTPSDSFPSYPKSNTDDVKTTSGADYSSGIGGIEYPGIGEKSSPNSPDTKPKSYSTSQDKKYPTSDQKSYDNEESIPTYSDSKIDTIKPSGEEYKGIGEIGTIPSGKSEIVGGRRPVKRPVKSVPNRIKGKNEEKTEQKYLPITSTISDAKSGSTDSKPYSSSVKTKTPEKVEQQEDLVYEAFLAGEGPQNQAVGSSGYGFNRPNAGSGGSPPFGASDKEEHAPPMPYEFEFDIQDDEYGSEQYRKEKMDDNGYLTGSYGFKDAEGLYRQVEYEASKEGFKVNRIKTNEPGTDNENPADVNFEVHKER